MQKREKRVLCMVNGIGPVPESYQMFHLFNFLDFRLKCQNFVLEL
jgi:hypothetical protein